MLTRSARVLTAAHPVGAAIHIGWRAMAVGDHAPRKRIGEVRRRLYVGDPGRHIGLCSGTASSSPPRATPCPRPIAL